MDLRPVGQGLTHVFAVLAGECHALIVVGKRYLHLLKVALHQLLRRDVSALPAYVAQNVHT